MKKLIDFIKAMFIIIPLFSLLVFFVNKKTDEQDEKIYIEQHYTFGEIKYVGYSKGSYAKIEYAVGNIKYKQRYPCALSCKEGEMYKVYYDNNNPQKIYVDYTKMKFSDFIKKEYTTAIVINITPKQFILRPNNELSYEFFYDRNRYSRTHKVTDSFIKNIDVGDYIKIIFNTNNPESSLLDIGNI